MVKSDENSMTLTIGQGGFDTDEWIEAFKSHFPAPPKGGYEASFIFEDEEYPLGIYECKTTALSLCEEEEIESEDIPEEVIRLSIFVLGMQIFSDLLNSVMCILLQETTDLFAETLELMVLASVLSGIDIDYEFEEEEEEE
jgi:hypothetical protein